MAKQIEKTKRMSKTDIDVHVAKILALKAEKKRIETELKALVAKMEGLYRKDAQVEELISGQEYEFVKIVKDNGKNQFDPEIVAPMVEALDPNVAAGVIYTETKVSADRFNALVKEGYITEEMQDSARLHKYTFSTNFRKKEKTPILAGITSAPSDRVISVLG